MRRDTLNALPIRTDEEPDFREALGLAKRHGLSFYDALYIGVGEAPARGTCDIGQGAWSRRRCRGSADDGGLAVRPVSGQPYGSRKLVLGSVKKE